MIFFYFAISGTHKQEGSNDKLRIINIACQICVLLCETIFNNNSELIHVKQVEIFVYIINFMILKKFTCYSFFFFHQKSHEEMYVIQQVIACAIYVVSWVTNESTRNLKNPLGFLSSYEFYDLDLILLSSMFPLLKTTSH